MHLAFFGLNNGAVANTGGVPTVANTTLIEIYGRVGNDRLSLDEPNGAMPRANMIGEGDNDRMVWNAGDYTDLNEVTLEPPLSSCVKEHERYGTHRA